MKTLTLTVLIVGLMGCAHRTIHERCSDTGTVSRYRDYDQCYAELSKEPKRKGILQSMGAGLQNASQRQSTNCTTSAFGNSAYTSCQ